MADQEHHWFQRLVPHLSRGFFVLCFGVAQGIFVELLYGPSFGLLFFPVTIVGWILGGVLVRMEPVCRLSSLASLCLSITLVLASIFLPLWVSKLETVHFSVPKSVAAIARRENTEPVLRHMYDGGLSNFEWVVEFTKQGQPDRILDELDATLPAEGWVREPHYNLPADPSSLQPGEHDYLDGEYTLRAPGKDAIIDYLFVTVSSDRELRTEYEIRSDTDPMWFPSLSLAFNILILIGLILYGAIKSARWHRDVRTP